MSYIFDDDREDLAPSAALYLTWLVDPWLQLACVDPSDTLMQPVQDACKKADGMEYGGMASH